MAHGHSARLGLALGLGPAVLVVGGLSGYVAVAGSDHGNPLGAVGYRALVADLAKGPGLKVHELTLREDGATVDATDGAVGAHLALTYQWHAGFAAHGRVVRDERPSFELTSIPVTEWTTRCAAARGLLSDPAARCEVTIAAPPPGGDAWITVTAIGTTSGVASLRYDRDGARLAR